MTRSHRAARESAAIRPTSQRVRDRFYRCAMRERQSLDDYLDLIMRRCEYARPYGVTELDAILHIVQSLTAEWQSWAATVAVRLIARGRGVVDSDGLHHFIDTLRSQNESTRSPPPGVFLPISEFAQTIHQIQTTYIHHYDSDSYDDDEYPLTPEPIPDDDEDPLTLESVHDVLDSSEPISDDLLDSEPTIGLIDPESMDIDPSTLEFVASDSTVPEPIIGDPIDSDPLTIELIDSEHLIEELIPFEPDIDLSDDYQDYMDFTFPDVDHHATFDDFARRVNGPWEPIDPDLYEQPFILAPMPLQTIPSYPTYEASFESSSIDIVADSSRPSGVLRPLDDDPLLVPYVGTLQLQPLPISEMPFVTDYHILHPGATRLHSTYRRPCGHDHVFPLGYALEDEGEESVYESGSDMGASDEETDEGHDRMDGFDGE